MKSEWKQEAVWTGPSIGWTKLLWMNEVRVEARYKTQWIAADAFSLRSAVLRHRHSPRSFCSLPAQASATMVQRLTYRRRHCYATKSNQTRVVKTPGTSRHFVFLWIPKFLGFGICVFAFADFWTCVVLAWFSSFLFNFRGIMRESIGRLQ